MTLADLVFNWLKTKNFFKALRADYNKSDARLTIWYYGQASTHITFLENEIGLVVKGRWRENKLDPSDPKFFEKLERLLMRLRPK